MGQNPTDPEEAYTPISNTYTHHILMVLHQAQIHPHRTYSQNLKHSTIFSWTQKFGEKKKRKKKIKPRHPANSPLLVLSSEDTLYNNQIDVLCSQHRSDLHHEGTTWAISDTHPPSRRLFTGHKYVVYCSRLFRLQTWLPNSQRPELSQTRHTEENGWVSTATWWPHWRPTSQNWK